MFLIFGKSDMFGDSHLLKHYTWVYIYIYIYIYIYMPIYIPKCVFGVFGHVFVVSGLVLGRLDLNLGVWTCIWASGLAFGCLNLYSVHCILVGCLCTCRVSVYLQDVTMDCALQPPREDPIT